MMLMLFLILRGYCWSCEVIVGLRMIFTMVFRIKLCLPLTGGRGDILFLVVSSSASSASSSV